ncbi:HlyD family secretion protein [Vibrio plantisponsor]|uniref:HlyD family secretion protein n=1 Tax=Vibrio plantisponsor TaxID=664643 RepID=A0ABU4IET0_9VIBR|nr:HlyD family secretion protein [Vibrio plantisponsor]MDW6017062.1 HlyD family secretion protein [Vibrio plantisponsor]NNM40829.1 HlyD family secretion protein [Vibrio plantisponsor]
MSNSKPEHEKPVSTLVPKSRRKTKRAVMLFLVPLLAVAGGVAIYLHGGRYVETENAYVKADKTSITSEVSGRIVDVPVEENQLVKAGDLLLQIDPTSYKIAVEQARANLNDVKTTLTTLKAEYQSKLANIDVSKSQHEYLKKEEKRQLDLLKKKYTSQSQYDSARQNTLLVELEVNALKKGLKQVEESLGGDVNAPIELHPKYRAAVAALDKAENDLAHVNLYAPADGVVTKVVEKGQYISPGSLAMMLVSDSDIWIEANFTETELTHVKTGQDVEVKVDYAPGFTWKGTVESLSPATGAEFSVIPAQNATGNWVKIAQRLPIRIRLEQEEGAPKLRAGLSAVVTVDTHHQRHLSL